MKAFLTASMLLSLMMASAVPAIALSQSSQATFALGPAGVALQPGNVLLVATNLSNTSDRDAFKVQIHSITLGSEYNKALAPLLTPTAFPVIVGEIDARQTATLQASFDGKLLTPRKQYLLVINGGYRPVNKGTYKDEGHEFTVATMVVFPPAAPGSSPFKTKTLDSHHTSGAPFPPQKPKVDLDEVNRDAPPVPTAPFVPGTPTTTPTKVKPLPFGDPPGIVVEANTSFLSLGISNASDSPVAEPSGASAGKVVFVSANSYAAYSVDGGSSFTRLNPTTIFPPDIGLCCDQIVHYAPTIDRFIWLMQGTATQPGYRLALASPADIVNSGGTAWTYWIVTPNQVGCTGFDYPDVSVSKNYLYMSWDAEGGSCSNGVMVVRTSLAGLQAGGQITVDFTDPADGQQPRPGHLMQTPAGFPTKMFWAGHNGSNTLRVFSWAEGPEPYRWEDVGISSWAPLTNSLSSTTPDGNNWIQWGVAGVPGSGGFPGSAITGATAAAGQLWFAWTAGTDSNFPQVHIEMVSLEPIAFPTNPDAPLHMVAQEQIWDPNYAFAYPALATNACTDEVGLSFEYGGNDRYPNHAVYFRGDPEAYLTTAGDAGTTRFGDYVTIRQAPPTAANLRSNLFSAFGYGLNKVPPPGSGTIPDVHYVLFGRPVSEAPLSCEIPVPH